MPWLLPLRHATATNINGGSSGLQVMSMQLVLEHYIPLEDYMATIDCNDPSHKPILKWIVFQLGKALSHLHAKGLAHGHLSPETTIFVESRWAWMRLAEPGHPLRPVSNAIISCRNNISSHSPNDYHDGDEERDGLLCRECLGNQGVTWFHTFYGRGTARIPWWMPTWRTNPTDPFHPKFRNDDSKDTTDMGLWLTQEADWHAFLLLHQNYLLTNSKVNDKADQHKSCKSSYRKAALKVMQSLEDGEEDSCRLEAVYSVCRHLPILFHHHSAYHDTGIDAVDSSIRLLERSLPSLNATVVKNEVSEDVAKVVLVEGLLAKTLLPETINLRPRIRALQCIMRYHPVYTQENIRSILSTHRNEHKRKIYGEECEAIVREALQSHSLLSACYLDHDAKKDDETTCQEEPSNAVTIAEGDFLGTDTEDCDAMHALNSCETVLLRTCYKQSGSDAEEPFLHHFAYNEQKESKLPGPIPRTHKNL